MSRVAEQLSHLVASRFLEQGSGRIVGILSAGSSNLHPPPSTGPFWDTVDRPSSAGLHDEIQLSVVNSWSRSHSPSDEIQLLPMQALNRTYLTARTLHPRWTSSQAAASLNPNDISSHRVIFTAPAIFISDATVIPHHADNHNLRPPPLLTPPSQKHLNGSLTMNQSEPPRQQTQVQPPVGPSFPIP